MSSTIKKTIQINPALFIVSKTRKNHHNGSKGGSGEKKVAPLISPNQLKTQLLRRIKEHKNRENDEGRKKNLDNNSSLKTNSSVSQDIGAYTDEFEESLNYLKSLSNQKAEMQKKTLKNYSSLLSSGSNNDSKRNNYPLPSVDLELPESLKEIVPAFQPVNMDPFKLNYRVDNVVPYGVLKGGVKPTYRNFVKTHKNYGAMNPQQSVTSVNPVINTSSLTNKNSSLSTHRMDLLKEKIKNKQEEIQQQQVDQIIMTQNLIQKPVVSYNTPNLNPDQNTEPNISLSIAGEKIDMDLDLNPDFELESESNQNQTSTSIHHPNTKKFLKRTIRRKYTLGKSKLKRTVGILLKDRNTRKNVLSAHKELKRTTIHDVKKYLRDHNLIKTGSNTPNDVVRKIYETAMLAGDITNHNNETLMFNLSREP
jgi:hypothetical protein